MHLDDLLLQTTAIQRVISTTATSATRTPMTAPRTVMVSLPSVLVVVDDLLLLVVVNVFSSCDDTLTVVGAVASVVWLLVVIVSLLGMVVVVSLSCVTV